MQEDISDTYFENDSNTFESKIEIEEDFAKEDNINDTIIYNILALKKITKKIQKKIH